MNFITYLIGLPLIGGLLCLLIPKAKEVIAVAISVITFAVSILAFVFPDQASQYFIFDKMSGFVALFISLFGFLIVLYSIKFMQKLSAERKISLTQYYCYVLWTLAASLGAVLSNNLILLLVFWGFLGLTLYLLMQIGASDFQESSAAAKKTFIIIGGSDCFMILGIAIIWFLTGTFQMDKISINFASYNSPSLPVIAFVCLTIAVFAKAGAMPFHTWIPDAASTAPIPITAYLPASLDKLLGIYLLARICLNLFNVSAYQHINVFLMFIGAITIIAAVFMALIQHDLKKMIAYMNISGAGYMVLGIGTNNPVGIAGGLFYMLSTTLWTSCLFLCAGSVECKTGTTDLDKLGGLAKYMPLTFLSSLIAALSISGVPPFNGFFSKWMIYQGLISSLPTSNFQLLTLLFIAAAMFGSALTLASFMKLLHGVFLGQASKHQNIKTSERISEVSWTMWLPQIFLAVLCAIFGVFAIQIPLKYFIFPSLSTSHFPFPAVFSGVWQPGLATLLIIVGIAFGFIFYIISGLKYRISDTYIGGETLPSEVRVTGADFYQTIKDIGFFKTMYSLAEQKMFDIYDWGRKIVSSVGSVLSELHTGNFETYLSWCLIGAGILLLVLVH
ncbi:MAG TPA: hypothetical protein DCX95_01865 [Elusimicrobia bacterium]|nr:hypothetical protein [Elusimicrobiota bacterium]